MSGFLALPLAGLLVPVAAIPAVSAGFGAPGWAAVAIGQSVGSAAAVLVELGWGLTGPQRVARMSAAAAYQTLLLSVLTKLAVLLPVSLCAAAVGWALVRTDPGYAVHAPEAALVAVGFAWVGLSANWFFIGRRRPWQAVGTDGCVRLVCVGAAVVLLVLGAPLISYPLLGLLVPGLVSPAVALLAARGGSAAPPRMSAARIFRTIRAQSTAVGARGLSAVYIALPVALVTVVAPGAVAVFAAGERLLRICLGGLIVVPNAMLGWVGGGADPEVRWQRACRAVWLNAFMGVVAAVGFGLLAPWVATLMFAGEVTLPGPLAWMFAGVLLLVCLSRATGSVALVALQRVDSILVSALVGAVLGVPVLLLMGWLWGAPGGVVGELVAECGVLLVQVRAIVRARRKHRRRRSAGEVPGQTAR